METPDTSQAHFSDLPLGNAVGVIGRPMNSGTAQRSAKKSPVPEGLEGALRLAGSTPAVPVLLLSCSTCPDNSPVQNSLLPSPLFPYLKNQNKGPKQGPSLPGSLR